MRCRDRESSSHSAQEMGNRPGLRQYPTSSLVRPAPQSTLPGDIVCGLVCLGVPAILRRRDDSTTLKSRSLISPSHFLLQQLLLLSTVDYSCLSSQSASTPIPRFGLHYCSSPYLSIRLLHERDGSKTHHRGLPTTGGEEWLEFRSL
jgi:hypothetical protein